CIVHLAAKPGVRTSFLDPCEYDNVNACGTQSVLELARSLGVKQFVFASSSSVYGMNPDLPWPEDSQQLRPINPYAKSKIAGEVLGRKYSQAYGLRVIVLRLFSVYGPRQRPDLAIHKITRLMLQGKPVPVYGDGTATRDYTHITDVVHGIAAA